MRAFLQSLATWQLNAREVSSLLEEAGEEIAADAEPSSSRASRGGGSGGYAAAYGRLRSKRVEGLLLGFQPEGRTTALWSYAAADLVALDAESSVIALRELEEIRSSGSTDPQPLVIELVRQQSANDARRALERIERHTVVLRVVPACILAFLLLSLPVVVAASIESQLASDASSGFQILSVSSDLVGFLSRSLTPAFFGLLGALLGIAFTMRPAGVGPHWRMERRHERGARLCLGALIGCLVAATGPLLLGSGDDYPRLLVLALVFGASQDTFYSRVLARANS